MGRGTTAMLGAILFGVICSVAKGNGAGVRDAAGNLSAPWLILPLLSAVYVTPRRSLAGARRPLLGAVLGVATTMLALIGFYLANAFVLDLGPHSTLRDVTLTMGAVGDIWFRYGLVSGAVCGTVGAWLAGRRAWVALGLLVAALLTLEPGAWIGLSLMRGQALSDSAMDLPVAAAEVICGLTLAAVMLARRGRRS